MPLELSNLYSERRAFVTGAASGFGLALCELLATEEWKLGMADVNQQALDDAGDRVQRLGGSALLYPLDVSDAGAFQEAADRFAAHFGGVDVVFNNAGISVAGLMEEIALEDWNDIIAVNLMGVVHGCRVFIPTMKQAGSGHLVNVASAAAIAAGTRMAPYNATKAAVLALSETLYGELHDAGVRVSVVMPTFFQTNIAKTQRSSEVERHMTEYLLQRDGYTAEDVARYVLEAMGRNELHILYPPPARRIWHMKRLMPKRFFKSLIELHRKTEVYLNRRRGQNAS